MRTLVIKSANNRRHCCPNLFCASDSLSILGTLKAEDFLNNWVFPDMCLLGIFEDDLNCYFHFVAFFARMLFLNGFGFLFQVLSSANPRPLRHTI